MPVNKPESYWQGFADGQKDMERQMAVEQHQIDPNAFVQKLDLFTAWLVTLMENNGSDEIGDDGAPIFANYGAATIATLATAFVYSRLMRILSAAIFKLNQGDFTEEHFHHELEHALHQMEKDNQEFLHNED
jgi:hypothetical protein